MGADGRVPSSVKPDGEAEGAEGRFGVKIGWMEG